MEPNLPTIAKKYTINSRIVKEKKQKTKEKRKESRIIFLVLGLVQGEEIPTQDVFS